jgi:hypothetical protein
VQTSLEGASYLEDSLSELNKPRRRPKRGEREPVQSSLELIPESCQGWGNAERCTGDEDFWECIVMNFARKVDCCYCGEFCSLERMEALTLTKADTHISTSMMGMQRTEKERAESQSGWGSGEAFKMWKTKER